MAQKLVLAIVIFVFVLFIAGIWITVSSLYSRVSAADNLSDKEKGTLLNTVRLFYIHKTI